jgi:mono/diheme cytochrome c family protein
MSRLIIMATLAACVCSCDLPHGSSDFERMREQRRADPYEASAYFRDGMVMRRPPAGTVTWEAQDVPPAVATGRVHGAPAVAVPVPVTPQQIAAGRHHYDIHCAVCHGADGSGRSVMADNMPEHRPPSLLSVELAAAPAGHLFEVISSGLEHMPAYGWALSARERWSVVAYVQSLQASHPPEAGESSDDHP